MAKGQPRVGATGYEAAPLTALQRRYAGALLLGCSTAGEIHGGLVSDGSLSMTAITLEHSCARRACALVSGPDDSYAAGRAVAQQLSAPTCAVCCWCAMA